MFGIPLPWIAFAVGIALLGSYKGGYHYGWSDRDNDMKLAIAKKNDEARLLEKDMATKLSDQETQLRKAQNEIVKKQSAMHELARTGRLRIPTSSCVQASPSATTASGNIELIDPPQTESERTLISALIDIASDGDKAIVKLNSCVAAYDKMRELINGQQ
jgi:hypothetical protein